MNDLSTPRALVVAAAVLLALPPTSSLTRSARAQEPASTELPPGQYSDIHDAELVELSVGAAKAFVVKPRRTSRNNAKPWVWYAPALTAAGGGWQLPSSRHADVVSSLLDQGFYFCGVDVGESYGSPAGRETYTQFHRLLVDRYGLDQKACLFPVSRGGLMHYNWAAEHPQCVKCIGAIYPVCNLRHYPGLRKLSVEYAVPVDQLRQEWKRHNPLDRLAPLAAANIPILHLQGDSDSAVPLETNSGELARRYKQLGGAMQLIVVPGKGHEFAPEFWKNPVLPEFFARHGTTR